MALNRQRTNLFVPVKVQEQGEHMKTPEVFISLDDLDLLCTEFDYFDLCFNMFFSVMDRGRLQNCFRVMETVRTWREHVTFLQQS